MVTMIRDDRIQKALDHERAKRRPIPSRAALAEEILRKHFQIEPDRKADKTVR